MGKMKVYELAKQLGLKNTELIEKLNTMGIEVKSHLSTLEDEVVHKLQGNSNGSTATSKNDKSDKKGKNEQMHIIRRNVRVINTDGEKSEVEQITTNIKGNIKKSHVTVVEENANNNSYSKEGLGVVNPRNNYDRKPRYGNNRGSNNVVITRNGKPVETPKEEVKTVSDEMSQTTPDASVETTKTVANPANRNNSQFNPNHNERPQRVARTNTEGNGYRNNDGQNNGYRNNNYNNNNNGYRGNGENQGNGYRSNNYNNNSGGYNNNRNNDGQNNGYRNNNYNNNGYRGNGENQGNGYRSNNYNNNNGGYNNNRNNDGQNNGYRGNNYNNNNNGGYRNNNYNNNNGGYNNNRNNDGQNSGYRNNNYNNNNGGYNNNRNGDGQNNGYRSGGYNNNNGGYRNNFGGNRNGDNTSYQVNKFIKQASTAPVEQKETREYNNITIDKKKYNDKNGADNKKDRLDKNKLREEQSRVSTSRLKGMEIHSEKLIDLYERDSDNLRKSNKRVRKQKPVMKQTKIIPMTEVKLPEVMTVKEFAEAIKKQASEIVKKLFALGTMATVNQDIDFDTAYLIASEFGITAEKEVKVTEEDILFDESEDDENDLVPRPPIVVVMGHVDHGKTSLLDRLRSANVVSGEAGGITQHIGAYKVQIQDREVCFLDTPGHEAFTAMRARGAQVTDIAIIIVAADDGIKPQTIEAIDHAKAAGVSIVVAINKIDKPTANIDRVKQELLEVGLVPEEWGGDTICVPISAMTGEGIDNLLEMLLLVADMKDLKANPNKQAKGTVLEARLDKTKGTIVSMLVQRGQLNQGDTIVVGDMVAKIRAMKDDKGRRVKEAGPSTPVEVLGLSHVPQTGDVFYEVENEKVAKQLIEKRIANARKDLIKQGSKVTLDDLFGQIKEGKIKDLNVIIKADVQGSVEALKESLEKLSNDEVRVRILHASTGGIKESDVTLASVSNAIIIGFNVRPESLAASQADKEKVDMRLYSVIYDAIDDVETALKGMIPKKYKEVMLGTAEIRKIFKITGVGIVAGCYVKSGKIIRNQMVRIVRDSIVVLSVKIDNLKREKDEVKEVAEGYECGIKLEKFSDIKEGDMLECYEMVEVKDEK